MKIGQRFLTLQYLDYLGLQYLLIWHKGSLDVAAGDNTIILLYVEEVVR